MDSDLSPSQSQPRQRLPVQQNAESGKGDTGKRFGSKGRRSGSTNTKAPVRGYQSHKSGYQLSLLTDSLLHGRFEHLLTFLAHKMNRSRATGFIHLK